MFMGLRFQLFIVLCLSFSTFGNDILTFEDSFVINTKPTKMAYSPIYNLLFTINNDTANIYDTITGQQLSIQSSQQRFTDLSISPSGRYLFIADYGGERTGYGTPTNPHYVHRYDMTTNTWEIGNAPKIAYRIEAVSDDRVLLLEQDQHVQLTLNKFAPIMTELHRVSSDYRGDIEYDPATQRVYHGNSGSSSHEITAFKIEGETISGLGNTGGYGTAQNGGGTATLSSDGNTFYYGRLQVESLDITNNKNTFAEYIYAASSTVAFGQNGYYDSDTADKLGSFDFSTKIYAVSDDGYHVWAFDDNTQNVYHYLIDQGSTEVSLESIEIVGPDIVNNTSTYFYSAIAWYSDGTRKDITTRCEWSLSSSTCAEIIGNNGTLTTKDFTSTKDFTIYVGFLEGGEANKEVTYNPEVTLHQIAEIESFPVEGKAYQIEYSPRYNLLFMRNSGSAIRVIDVSTQAEIDLYLASQKFTDMDLTPDNRYLFAADYGGERTGYGTPINPHYVHRYDLKNKEWKVLLAPKIAYKIEAVSSTRVLLQEHDQHVDMTLNSFESDSMEELSRIRADYYGDFEYDNSTSRVYHGSSGSSSREIHARKVVGDTLINAGNTGGYGTAQNGGGTSVLSSDGKYFYYGRLQVEALDITNNRNYYPENIYAGSEAIAFGSSYYYDAYEGEPLGSLGYDSTVHFVSDDGNHLWSFEDDGDILHHYQLGPASEEKYLDHIEIIGVSSLGRLSSEPYTVMAYYDNDSIEDVTWDVTWEITPNIFASINDDAILSTYSVPNPGQFTLTATYIEGQTTVLAEKNISYIPGIVTFYIDSISGNDDNNGLSNNSAFASIMKGVREACDGDIILLAPGTYNEVVNFSGKAITIRSQADAAVIDGGSSQIPLVNQKTKSIATKVDSASTGVLFENEEGPDSILSNIIIRNCYIGIFCGNSSPTIKNVTVVNNGNGVVAWDNANPTILNSIFWYNILGDVQGTNADFCCSQYNIIGNDNIQTDPAFVNPLDNDYHLKSRMGHYQPLTGKWILDAISSPCIDKACPADYPQAEEMPNGGKVNMGAYGGTPFASKSPNQWPNIADLNKDGIVNLIDLSILSENWLWQADWH